MLLSLVVMLMILITLMKIYNRLNIANGSDSFTQHVFLFLPFSLYLGWISVAALANLSVVQVAMGWENLGLSEVKMHLSASSAATAPIARLFVLSLFVFYTRQLIVLNSSNEPNVWNIP